MELCIIILSQIRELNGYLDPTILSKSLTRKACHDLDLEHTIEHPIRHLLLRYGMVSVKRRLQTAGFFISTVLFPLSIFLTRKRVIQANCSDLNLWSKVRRRPGVDTGNGRVLILVLNIYES